MLNPFLLPLALARPMAAAAKPKAAAATSAGAWPERRVAILLLVVMIDLSAVALVVPLLPLRMRALGVRPELVGLIGSVYAAAQVPRCHHVVLLSCFPAHSDDKPVANG